MLLQPFFSCPSYFSSIHTDSFPVSPYSTTSSAVPARQGSDSSTDRLAPELLRANPRSWWTHSGWLCFAQREGTPARAADSQEDLWLDPSLTLSHFVLSSFAPDVSQQVVQKLYGSALGTCTALPLPSFAPQALEPTRTYILNLRQCFETPPDVKRSLQCWAALQKNTFICHNLKTLNFKVSNRLKLYYEIRKIKQNTSWTLACSFITKRTRYLCLGLLRPQGHLKCFITCCCNHKRCTKLGWELVGTSREMWEVLQDQQLIHFKRCWTP